MIRMQQVMELFGVTRKTVHNWIILGMPSYHVGKLLFFDKYEIVEWVKNNGKT